MKSGELLKQGGGLGGIDFDRKALVVGCAGFCSLVLVLFADFIGVGFGSYSEQRFALSLALGFFTVLGFYLNLRLWVHARATHLKIFVPTVVLSSAFILTALPFAGETYVWVEPGMYAFFFLSICLTGAVLGGSAFGAQYVLILIFSVAVVGTLYGFSSITTYLFVLLESSTNFVLQIPHGFDNIRYWSHIATWCLPLMPLVVLVGPLKNKRLWSGFVLCGMGLWWWILFLTTARGSFLAILLGVAISVILLGKRSIPWLKIFAKSLLLGIFFWFVLAIVIPSFFGDGLSLRTISVGSSGRLPMFAEAWAMSLQNFPLGMGPQSWLTHQTLTSEYAGGIRFAHPHNMYLMWAAEYGWILVSLFFVLGVQVTRLLWVQRRKVLREKSAEGSLVLAGFTASVTAALVHAGVSAVFMAPGSMLVGFFVPHPQNYG